MTHNMLDSVMHYSFVTWLKSGLGVAFTPELKTPLKVTLFRGCKRDSPEKIVIECTWNFHAFPPIRAAAVSLVIALALLASKIPLAVTTKTAPPPTNAIDRDR